MPGDFSLANSGNLQFVRTSTLEIAFEQSGAPDAFPVLLMHGFPYDPRTYDEVVPLITAQGFRTIVPYLRGYGKTRFLSPDTMRSGQQAALGRDLLELLDALNVRQAVLAGYDWGGRAACIVAALWPERARGLVTCNGYNLQNIPASVEPAPPDAEHRFWYQYYFHTERGRAGLTADRRAFCRLLWQLWSPTWRFDDATFEATAISFDNPDFVEVVIHSYRHRYRYVDGDPAFDEIEARLTVQPAITVPAISLNGADNGIFPEETAIDHKMHFSGPYERRVIAHAGHNVPQEAPNLFAEAVIKLCAS